MWPHFGRIRNGSLHIIPCDQQWQHIYIVRKTTVLYIHTYRLPALNFPLSHQDESWYYALHFISCQKAQLEMSGSQIQKGRTREHKQKQRGQANNKCHRRRLLYTQKQKLWQKKLLFLSHIKTTLPSYMPTFYMPAFVTSALQQNDWRPMWFLTFSCFTTTRQMSSDYYVYWLWNMKPSGWRSSLLTS